MSGKKLLAGFLLVFVVASVGFLLFKESRRGSQVAARPSGPAVAVSGPGVVAYYFHGRVRCASCVKIGNLSGKAIRERFPEEIRKGLVAFREVNIDDPENRHFVDDYGLSSQSLVIVEYRDGRQVRWKNLEKVWTLLDSEKEFLPYVQEGVSSYLKGA
ncbi:MAG: nitrophenyl compound nitroreductase subunit ArsF family protein [bacterium]|nr:nitrophenyl compound nitroreductase subunit ArsF family protein [bacterium]